MNPHEHDFSSFGAYHWRADEERASSELSVTPPIDGSVSCTSATFCIAVDTNGNALSYNGSLWSAARLIDPNTALTSVSCLTSSFCVAVDASGHVLGFDGRRWSSPRAIDPHEQLVAVSCPSSNYCMAVDSDGNDVVAH